VALGLLEAVLNDSIARAVTESILRPALSDFAQGQEEVELITTRGRLLVMKDGAGTICYRTSRKYAAPLHLSIIAANMAERARTIPTT
jgi:hypothetical protein